MQYSSTSENYSSSLRDSPSKWGNKDDKGYAYKKSSYQYSGSGSNNASYLNKSPDQNIDQLDALLEDLKNERQITRDRDLLPSSTNYRTIERERAEPSGTVTRTTRVIKTSKQSGVNPVLDDVENFSTSDYSTLRSNALHDSTLRRNDFQTKDISYGSTKHLPSNIYESRNKIYESNRTLDNTELIPSTTDTTTTTQLQNDLQNISLTDDILPVPGTKVTTTVRTYTYEVPANSIPTKVVDNRYNTIERREYQSGGVLQPQRSAIPQTVLYNTESYSTIDKNTERPVVSNQVYEIREHRESNTILNNNNNLTPQAHSPAFAPGSAPPPGNTSKTIVYNVNTTENIHSMPEPNVYYPRSPAHSPRSPHGLHGPHDPHVPHSPHGAHSPPQRNLPGVPTTNKYYYKESSNVINTIHGPGGALNEPNISPIHNAPQKLAPTGYPPHSDGYPPHAPNPTTVTYKYSSSSTSNTRRGPNDYGTPSPTMPPAPFPVDGADFPMGNGSPPQRVDDLMQSFGNADTVDRSNLDTPHRKREIDTAVASPNQPIIPSVNRAGKEIYYPPGHEIMMTKREEMSAGSAAGGRWAKGSGMYEYESGSKSKTKTKSGGAMVPLCLPLCCAMPCSIM